jgi:Flp pilus assembly protein TadG
MRRITDRLRKHKNGTALVEMALVLPLLLLLVFGMIDFGLVIKDRMALIQAAREGARIAAIGDTTANIRSTVVASSPSLAITNDTTHIVLTTGAASTDPTTWPALGDTTDSQGVAINNATDGNLIQVHVVSTHNTITHMFFGGAGSLTLSASSVMRKEAR